VLRLRASRDLLRFRSRARVWYPSRRRGSEARVDLDAVPDLPRGARHSPRRGQVGARARRARRGRQGALRAERWRPRRLRRAHRRRAAV